MADRIHARHAEAQRLSLFFQQGKISLALPAKPKVIAYIEVVNAQALYEHILDKIFGLLAGQMLVEFQEQHTVNTAGPYMDQFLTQAGQAGRRLIRAKKLHGLRLEENHRGGHPILPCFLTQSGKHSLVTKMHPIKITDGRHAASMRRTQIVLTANKLHVSRGNRPRCWR